MSKFSAHVAVHGDDGATWFNPGDEVPEWASKLVGDHVLEAPAASEAESEAEPEAEEAGGEPETAAATAETVDFTGPKPPRATRQNRR